MLHSKSQSNAQNFDLEGKRPASAGSITVIWRRPVETRKLKPKPEKDESPCRVCLQEGILPIHGNDWFSDVSQDLNTCAGINVQADDAYPKHLCENCNYLLKCAVQLRKTAQYSEQILKQNDLQGITGNISLNHEDDDEYMSEPLGYDKCDQLKETKGNNHEENKIYIGKLPQIGCDLPQTEKACIIKESKVPCVKKPSTCSANKILKLKPMIAKNRKTANKVIMDKPYYYCKQCQIHIATKPEYLQHTLGNHDDKEYVQHTEDNHENKVCLQDKQDNNKNSVIMDKPYYYCKKCHIYFATRPKYLQHIYNHKNKEDAIDPQHTQDNHTTKNNAVVLQRTEDNHKKKVRDKPYKCQWCEIHFATKPEYQQHFQDNHRPRVIKDMPYYCKWCQIHLTTKLEHHQHMRDNHSDRVKRDKPRRYCKRCDIHFATMPEYLQHLRDKHENKEVCPFCNKEYNHSYFQSHLIYHNTDPAHVCDICSKQFITRGQLGQHRRIHFFELPFKCTLCSYRGRDRYNLKLHMRTHSGEKPYKCPHCPKSFNNKSNSNKHILTHKAERDFKCETCQRGFYGQTDLNRHISVAHLGIKEYLCDACGKSFGSRGKMMQHTLGVHKRKKCKKGGQNALHLFVDQQDSIAEAETLKDS